MTRYLGNRMWDSKLSSGDPVSCVTLEGVNTCWREGIACDLSAVSRIKSSKLQQEKCRLDFSKKLCTREGREAPESLLAAVLYQGSLRRAGYMLVRKGLDHWCC